MSRLRVFLCHSSEDKLRVRDLCRRLHEDGFEPWLDEEKLLPGQDWEFEISAAVEASDVVIVCLSPISVNKVGYVQKELRRILDIAECQPEGRIFVIPVRFEDCPVPAKLSRLQHADLFVEGGYEKLCLALRASIIGRIPEPQRPLGKIARYLTAGDRFAEQCQYDAATKQYERVLEIDANNIDARRRVVRVARQQLTLKAFEPGNTVLDIGMRDDYDNFAFVSDDEINNALTHLYEIRSLDPQLEDDLDLLLDEALILKTNGGRVGEAITALEKAHDLAPENAAVNAELGLLLAVPRNSRRKADAVDLIRRAVHRDPDQARYHFYLGRALAEIYACPYAGLQSNDANEGQGCAEAIREYRKAADLATASDLWSRAIRFWAQLHSMDIFHCYARQHGDIRTPRLAMPLDDRLKELEYLIPTGYSRSQTGPEDNPNFWIPQLEYATGNFDKAEQHVRELMQRDHDEVYPAHTQQYWEDSEFIRIRAEYARFLVEVLQKTGHDQQLLATIQSILQSR